MVPSQGRIQDLPKGVPIPRGRGVPIYYPAKFSRKLHKNERHLDQEGACVQNFAFFRSVIVSLTWQLTQLTSFQFSDFFNLLLKNILPQAAASSSFLFLAKARNNSSQRRHLKQCYRTTMSRWRYVSHFRQHGWHGVSFSENLLCFLQYRLNKTFNPRNCESKL